MFYYPNCDLAILTSGTIRTNELITKGEVTLRTINEILPFPDKIVLLRIPGDALQQILENSVSQWPAFDGRFSCISGLKYSFDPERPAGSRVHSVLTAEGN